MILMYMVARDTVRWVLRRPDRDGAEGDRMTTIDTEPPAPRYAAGIAVLLWVVLLAWGATLRGDGPMLMVMVWYWPALLALWAVNRVIFRR